MNMYIYNSDVGRFEIRWIGHKRYELWIKEELLGSYDSAENAAEDVANFNTDYIEWDRFRNKLETFPTSLNEWAEIKEEISGKS